MLAALAAGLRDPSTGAEAPVQGLGVPAAPGADREPEDPTHQRQQQGD